MLLFRVEDLEWTEEASVVDHYGNALALAWKGHKKSQYQIPQTRFEPSSP